jgi:hypothetical protein
MMYQPKLSDDVNELQREVIHLRQVVDYMGWKAINTLQQMDDEYPEDLNDIIVAFVSEEAMHVPKGKLQ